MKACIPLLMFGSLVGFGGCVKPTSQYDHMVQWLSMVRSPMYVRYHPDRWEYAILFAPGLPGPGEYQISLNDVIAEDAKGMYGRPWFPDRTRYGPFAALTGRTPTVALLLDEQDRPMWAGAKIIPMRVKGQLKTLVLVEEIRTPMEYRLNLFGPLGGDTDFRPFYRFILLHMHVISGDEMKGCPLELLGVGFLADMVNGDSASCVMDVSGKGDDLLGTVMLDGSDRWDEILVTEPEAAARPRVIKPWWTLVAADAWGRRALNTELPKGVGPLHVSIIVKTSPKITLSAFNNGDNGAMWKTVTYDPDTFTGAVID